MVCSGKIADQSSDGIVKLDKDVYNCNWILNITVSDTDLIGNGTQNVTVWSSYESIPETVTLTENPSGSGIFKGTLTLASNAPSNGDGYLSVQHDNTITVQYIDLNDGKGGLNVQKTDIATTDCQGPIITNVQVPNSTLRGESAIVSYSTDEISNSKVYYGTTFPPSNYNYSSALVTSHSISIQNLYPCTMYYYYVESCDPYENCTINNNSGNYYNFTTKALNVIFNDSVESGNIGWTAQSPWAITEEDSSSPTHSWTDSPGRLYESGINISLTSPVIDISSFPSALLSFIHKYDFEATYDFGYLEFSTNGVNWNTIATYTGYQANWTKVEIEIQSPHLGSSTFRFRFRLYTDYGVSKDGWHIDDIKIENFRSCSYGVIGLNKDCYLNNDTIQINLLDMDLNQNPNLVETVSITVLSNTEPSGETVILNETGKNSAYFTGSINTTTNSPPSPNLLSISNGDTITGRYYDANDGSGNPRWAEDNATVDLINPTISNVSSLDLTGSTVEISWVTNEVSNSRVIYDTTKPPSASNVFSSNYVLNHSVQLTGLTQCTPYYYYVQSTDPCGNTSTDTNGGSYYSFETGKYATKNFVSTDVPKDIKDWQTTYSNIIVTDKKTINKVIVTIGNITHPFDEDLDIYLIAPDNTSVELSTDNGSAGDNYINTVFDDDANTSIVNGIAPFTGTFKPEGSLSVLKGKNAQGTWKLKVFDDDWNYQGTLNSWSLTLIYVPQPCKPELEYYSSTFTDTCNGTGSGSNDGIIDPGEDVLLQLTLKNSGGANATGVSATISTSTNKVTITDNYATFPNILEDENGTSQPNHFSFKTDPSTSCGSTINFNIHMVSQEKPTGWDDSFSFTVGQVIPPSQQTLLSESFDGTSFPPTGWAQVDVSGTSGNWARSTNTVHPYGGGTHSGAGLAYFNSYDADSGDSTRLYRTSVNTIPSAATSATFSLWMYHDTNYSNRNDRIQIQVSLNGNDWTNVGSAISRYDGSTGWKEHSFDFSSYIGQSIYIGILGISEFGNDCHIDDVSLVCNVPLQCLVNQCLWGPRAIPDGSNSTQAVKVTKATENGNTILVDWDNRCEEEANIIYGNLSQLSNYTISGSVCNIGDNNSWNIGSTTNIWFVLVSDNNNGKESSWGLSSTGQRNDRNASGQCGNTLRDNSGICP